MPIPGAVRRLRNSNGRTLPEEYLCVLVPLDFSIANRATYLLLLNCYLPKGMLDHGRLRAVFHPLSNEIAMSKKRPGFRWGFQWGKVGSGALMLLIGGGISLALWQADRINFWAIGISIILHLALRPHGRRRRMVRPHQTSQASRNLLRQR